MNENTRSDASIRISNGTEKPAPFTIREPQAAAPVRAAADISAGHRAAAIAAEERALRAIRRGRRERTREAARANESEVGETPPPPAA